MNAEQWRQMVDGIVSQVRDWRVAVVYGATSPEDRLYTSEKPEASWSVHTVICGLAKLGIHAEWVDPTEPGFADRVRTFDAAFVNAHGEFGEDGHLQGMLALLGVPYTGSGVAASAVSADKRLTKLVVSGSGVPVPPFRRVRLGSPASARPVVRPTMAKASKGGSSVGLELVCDQAGLSRALDEMIEGGFDDAILEPFVEGVSVTVPVLVVDGSSVMLPPIQCLATTPYYDANAKLSGDEDGTVRYRAMLDPDDADLSSLHELTARILHSLDFAGALRADFLLPDLGDPVLLELNTIPGVQDGSNLVLSAAAAGINYPDLLAVILGSAMDARKIPSWAH